MPMDAESCRLIDWMERGDYDALLKKYPKTLLFCVCEAVDGPMIEEFAFSNSYSNSDSQEVSINKNRSGTFIYNSTTEITPSQMRSLACKIVWTLVQLMRTLDKMPEEVKSVLDPCEDVNNDNQDDEASLGADSNKKEEDSESDSEASNSEDDQYIVAPIEKRQIQENNGAIDDTQDPKEDEEQLGRIKDWISSYHLDTVALTDILSNFPDISVILIGEKMDKLVKESFISKAAGENYVINERKNFEYKFDAVKEEGNGQMKVFHGKAGYMSVEHMYMKALYHTLPLNYITVGKLQYKLGQASPNIVCKLIDKMTHDGFVAAASNHRLGKRAVHFDLTKKKLNDLDKKGPTDKPDYPESETAGNKHKDLSKCGGPYSIGSDATRPGFRSDAYMNGSTRTEQAAARKRKHGGNTLTSRAEPAASREGFALGVDNDRANANKNDEDDMYIVMDSRSTQGKRLRKTNTVKEPIQQYMKRQKAQVV